MSSEATPSEQKATVQRLFDKVVNLGQLEVADELFASDLVFHDPVTDKYTGWGSPQVKNVVNSIRTAFPDFSASIEAQMAAEGNLIVTQWTATGTYAGHFDGLSFEPTDERVEVSGMSISRFNDGRIVEMWLMHDPDEPPEEDWPEMVCKHCKKCCK